MVYFYVFVFFLFFRTSVSDHVGRFRSCSDRGGRVGSWLRFLGNFISYHPLDMLDVRLVEECSSQVTEAVQKLPRDTHRKLVLSSGGSSSIIMSCSFQQQWLTLPFVTTSTSRYSIVISSNKKIRAAASDQNFANFQTLPLTRI